MPPPQKPKVVRKDPIVLRLERIKEERLHKAEEMQRLMEREEEERENQVTLEAQSAIKGEEEKKGKESPYRVKLRAKGNLGQKKKKKSGERTPNKKKNKWVIKFTPPGEKHGNGSTGDSVDRLHFAQPSHKPHVNGPNILDLDKKDKFSKKLTKMSGGAVAQRNELNKLLLTKRKKERELREVENELMILNGLQQGEMMGVGKAYKVLDDINEVKAKTKETDLGSQHYMSIIDMMHHYPANNADWLEQIDEIVLKMQRKEDELAKEIREAKDEHRELMQNLPLLQKEVEGERLHTAFLARLDAQKSLEDRIVSGSSTLWCGKRPSSRAI